MEDARGPLVIVRGAKSARAIHDATGWQTLCTRATSAAMASLTPPEWARDVLIAADRDGTHASEWAAERLAERLSGQGVRVRIAMPAGPIPEGTSRITFGALAADAVRESMQGAREWIPASVESRTTRLAHQLSSGAASVSRYFATAPKPMPWIFDGLVPRGVVGLVVAAGGTGKGFLTLHMAIQAALGHAFCGHASPGPQDVLMLGWEDADHTLHQRFLDSVAQLYPTITAKERKTLSDHLDIWPVGGEGYYLDHLVDVLSTSQHRDMIVLDPLKLFLNPGMDIMDESDATTLHRQLGAVLVAHHYETTILVCHHVPKNSQISGKQLAQSAVGGAVAVVDLARLSIHCRTVAAAEIAKRGLDPSESYIEAAVAKTNYFARIPSRILFRRGRGGALVEVQSPT